MYTDFFGFDEKPFRLKPDPRFFYSNAIYEKAYSSILSSILERKGFTVLTGEAGTGKTALIRKCVASLDSSVRFIFFSNSIVSFEDILDQLCDELGLSVKAGEYFNKTRILESFFAAQIRSGKTFAVLIDDAQNLEAGILHNLQSLSRSPRTQGNLLQFVLVGLPELRDKLKLDDLILCSLEPLKSQEIGRFINQQLSAVGYKKGDLFTPDAIRRIAAYSKGIPRSICALCDSALFIASLSQNRLITPEIVEEAAQNCFLTEGMAPDIWPTADNAGKAGNRTVASNSMPVSLSQAVPDSGEPKTAIRADAPNSVSPESLKPIAAGSKSFKAVVQPPPTQPTQPRRTNKLLIFMTVTALLFGSGALVFHYQRGTDFTNTLLAARNWLNDTSSPSQAKPDSAPSKTVAESAPAPAPSAPAPSAPSSDALPADAEPQTSVPVIAVVELPAVNPVPSSTVIAAPKPSQQLSGPSLQASQSVFIELKGSESASHRGNNVINFNVPAASTAAMADSRRVNELLERAGQQLAKQQFISPAQDNALDTFRQVLRLRPGYGEALAGIETIKEYYKRQADAAARSADWEKAQALYETALMVDSEDRFLADLLRQVRQKNRR